MSGENKELRRAWWAIAKETGATQCHVRYYSPGHFERNPGVANADEVAHYAPHLCIRTEWIVLQRVIQRTHKYADTHTQTRAYAGTQTRACAHAHAHTLVRRHTKKHPHLPAVPVVRTVRRAHARTPPNRATTGVMKKRKATGESHCSPQWWARKAFFPSYAKAK